MHTLTQRDLSALTSELDPDRFPGHVRGSQRIGRVIAAALLSLILDATAEGRDVGGADAKLAEAGSASAAKAPAADSAAGATNASGAPADSFEVRSFTVDGPNPLRADTTEDTLAPFLGRQRGIERLQAAAHALEARLRASGNGLYTVILPPQEIGDSVRLAVVPRPVAKVAVVAVNADGRPVATSKDPAARPASGKPDNVVSAPGTPATAAGASTTPTGAAAGPASSAGSDSTVTAGSSAGKPGAADGLLSDSDTAKARAALPTLREGATPNLDALSRDLELANESPARQMAVRFSESDAAGAVDARLEVQQSPLWSAGLRLDNTGSDQPSRSRLAASLSRSDLFGLDHSVTASYTTSPQAFS